MEHILVIDYPGTLIEKFRSKALVVRTSDLSLLPEIAHKVGEHNKLHCIQVILKGKLTDIPVNESWNSIPISFFVPEFGDIGTFIRKAGLWRQLSARVFLSSANPANFGHLQLIASLGVDCGIWFDQGHIDWQAANDLLHYAIYGKVPHGTIEPFVYLVDHYQPTRTTDFSAVYFNDPGRYCYVDPEGRLAMTAGKLARKEFIGTLQDLGNIEQLAGYQDVTNAIQEAFLNQGQCTRCPSWRICLGKFEKMVEANPGCTEFFQDVMEAAEFVQQNANDHRRKELCRL